MMLTCKESCALKYHLVQPYLQLMLLLLICDLPKLFLRDTLHKDLNSTIEPLPNPAHLASPDKASGSML